MPATTIVSVASDKFYDLGQGPMEIRTTGGLVEYTTSDTEPSASAPIAGGASHLTAQVRSPTHVWAKTPLGQMTNVIVTPTV
jgi:hypothetical protein